MNLKFAIYFCKMAAVGKPKLTPILIPKFFWTVLFLVLPSCLLANSTESLSRHPLSRATLSLRPACGGLATPPFQSGVGRIKKSIRGFFYDCRIAVQFCMLLSRASMRLLLFGK